MRRLVLVFLSLTLCRFAPAAPLRVVATTTLVGDIVHRIGGDAISLHVLIPPNSDPHVFEPTPRDVALLSDADIVFINGVGLENFLKILNQANPHGKLVSVSDGIAFRHLSEPDEDEDHDHHGNEDPHVWLNPLNVVIWAQNISKNLSESDPAHAHDFAERTEIYTAELQGLDQWIQNEVQKIPGDHRLLVSDHNEWGYFADRYGFQCVGHILHGFSTLAEPSAHQIAELQETISAKNIHTIFIGKTVNPILANRIAHDTKIKVISLYGGSLGEPGGEASTYLDYMKYNVNTIVHALENP